MKDTRDRDRTRRPGHTGWIGQRARFVLLLATAVVVLVLMALLVI